MPRLSDRAFHIIKTEIEHQYTDDPTDQIERAILLARFESLRIQTGAPMTRVELWEVLCDVAPNFNRGVLMEAGSIDNNAPWVGASAGVGAVTVLVATAIGTEAIKPIPREVHQDRTLSRSGDDVSNSAARSRNQKAATDQGSTQGARLVARSIRTNSRTNSVSTNRHRNRQNKIIQKPKNAFESAKVIGWQAVLKGQNPPHSVHHWRETAALWEKALAELDKVSPLSPQYLQARLKKVEYRRNLAEVRSRQLAAARRAKQATHIQSLTQVLKPAVNAESRASADLTVPTSTSVPTFSLQTVSAPSQPLNLAPAKQDQVLIQTQVTQVQVQQKPIQPNPIQLAKKYGWQAAVAGQNSPHPPEKWADISRLWQTALLNLNKVKPEDPHYAEAQQVKAVYQRNLAEIRDRYQREQTANQRFYSLQASLNELNYALPSGTIKHERMEAILAKLKTIPADTEAHAKAQQLIADTTVAMNAIALTPRTPRLHY
ncbi:MAG: hypothetical protein AAF703_16745 [Cyanobacteria bacterium P01_D01_bin.105]